MAEPVIVAWSGGKDSTLALESLRGDPQVEVVALLTTVTGEYDRVSIHGVRRSLLRQQAAAAGLPLYEAILPPAPSNAAYEEAFAQTLELVRKDFPAARTVGFGDLFLADIRAYREAQLGRLGFKCSFPVWGKETAALGHDFVARGYRAVVVCIDLLRLARCFAGVSYDTAFLRALPASVDPCGENGEFHTFVTDGPIFARDVPVRRGIVVERSGCAFADLLPAEPGGASAGNQATL